MIALATPLLSLALGAGAGLVNNDWVLVDESSPCDMTDVDFSDRLHGFATCTIADAMTTSDGGLTWTVFGTGLQQSLLYAHAASADDLYAARLGVYHSANGGETWDEIGDLSANGTGSIFDMHFGDAGHLVAIQGGTLLYSIDGGESWDTGYPGAFGVYFDELHFPSALVGYATGGDTSEQGSLGSVLRSDDGGQTWDLLSFENGEITAADFFDEDHGVAATLQGQLYTTDDGAASWQPLADAPDGALLLDIAHRDDRHWYAVSIQGCLYETQNAGLDWETGYCDPDANALVAIAFAGDGGPAIAGGNGGVALLENRILVSSFD